jgi:hypothetical protein
MSFYSWLRDLKTQHYQGAAARRPKFRFRPSVEALEERWTPAVFNNAAQWSAINNPNGVWSYGYLAPSSVPAIPNASTFTLYTEQVQVPGTPGGFIEDWRVPGSTDPNAIFNPFAQVVSVGTVTWQPHQASFSPGPNGEYSDYRFAAPHGGRYSLSATFTSIDVVGGANKDIHVLINGNELYDDILSGTYGSAKTFSATVRLAKGDQVDFVLGFGAGPNSFDNTALDATLETGAGLPSSVNEASAPSVIDLQLLDASRALSANSLFSSNVVTVDAHANVAMGHAGIAAPNAPAVSPTAPPLNQAASGAPAATAAVRAAAADAVFGDVSGLVVNEPLRTFGSASL